MNQSVITVPVALEGRAYEAHVGFGLLDQLGERTRALGLKKRCAVITDSIVGPLYGERALASLREAGFDPFLLTAPAGEASKSMERAEILCREMIRNGCDRHAFVLALGGGVVGDLAGFVAGIFYRGVPYVQVPTTIVSQVDSSVGGKTGVNAAEGKNLIGVFHQPKMVLADVAVLDTLPTREFNEGFAEIIKHAAIRDATMVPMIEQVSRGDRSQLAELIARNIGIKAAVVVADEHETKGIRALLNFGHTIGHAIEAAAGYGELLHGEAISLGIVAAARLSCQHSGLGEASENTLVDLLRAFALPLRLPANVETESILGYLARDKKFLEGQIRFVLLRALGDAFVSSDLTLASMKGAIEALRE